MNFETLANLSRFEVFALLEDPQCDEEILRYFCNSEDLIIRKKALINPSCPCDILDSVCDNLEMYDFRIICIFNPNCPQELIRKQAHSDCYLVRAAAALRADVPVLEALIETETSDYVIAHLLANPNCTKAMAEKLCNSTNPAIRINAMKELQSPHFATA